VPELSEFEGLPVTEVGVEMPGASGGLHEAMKFQPVEWRSGDEQFVVLRGTVNKIRHEPIDRDEPDGDQRRVHILKVEEAFPIDAAHVSDYVAKRREEIRKAREEAEGVMSLPLGEGEEGGEDAGDLPVGDDDLEPVEA
jgi:hypothetical protein